MSLLNYDYCYIIIMIIIKIVIYYFYSIVFFIYVYVCVYIYIYMYSMLSPLCPATTDCNSASLLISISIQGRSPLLNQGRHKVFTWEVTNDLDTRYLVQTYRCTYSIYLHTYIHIIRKYTHYINIHIYIRIYIYIYTHNA